MAKAATVNVRLDDDMLRALDAEVERRRVAGGEANRSTVIRGVLRNALVGDGAVAKRGRGR